MKKCPTCNRTYADDGFTFCLEDGALLSAPYNPKETPPHGEPGDAPPTIQIADSSKQPKPSQPDLVPTIAAPAPPVPVNKESPRIEGGPQAKRSKLPYIAISVAVALIAIAGLSAFGIRRSQCPDLEVVCFPYDNRASCELTKKGRYPISIGEPSPQPGIVNVKWSATGGTIYKSSLAAMAMDATGLAGQQITVTATFEGGWFCSNTLTTTFTGSSRRAVDP